MKNFVLVSAMLFLLSGCSIFNWNRSSKPPEAGGKPSLSVQVDNASAATDLRIIAADNARLKAEQQTTDLMAKVKANVVSARQSNVQNPVGIPQVKVEGELQIAEGRLTSVAVDQVELAAAAQRNLLVEQGRTLEARAAYDAATKDGIQKTKELEAARIAMQTANAERDAARAAELKSISQYQTMMAANQIEFERRMKAAENKVMEDQVRMLNWAAIGSLALFALGLGFGGVAGLKLSWPFGVISILCFGLAQILGLWWFKWAVAGAALIIGGVSAWWVWTHYKAGTLKEDAEEKASKLNAVLQQVIPVLDKAYENAETAGKELLDKTVFQPLGNLMNRDEKKLVHQIRGDGPVIPTPQA